MGGCLVSRPDSHPYRVKNTTANRTHYESDRTYMMHTAHSAHVGEVMKIT